MVGLDPRNSQGMSDWITERLPTKADGDFDGDVRLANADRSDYILVHWSYVATGAPWQRTSYWKPPAEPTPAKPTEPDRIAALEQRVAELEAQLRPSAEPPEVSYRQAQLEHLRAKTALLRAQVEAFC
jgi:hypothetical protein